MEGDEGQREGLHPAARRARGARLVQEADQQHGGLPEAAFRTPPGIPGQIYNDIGVASVAMGGGDILPGLEKGVIDAAEWCCPKPDMTFGFQKVLKHYYLEGLHQVVVNADLYINGDIWKTLSPTQQKAIEVAANASLMKTVAYRIHENGKALKELTENHGVILHDTPPAYFKEYGDGGDEELREERRGQSLLQEGVGQPEGLGRRRDPVLGARAEDQRRHGRRLRRVLKKAGGTARGAPAAAPAKAAREALVTLRSALLEPGRHLSVRERAMAEPQLTDEMIAGRRPDSHGHLPEDMPRWMSTPSSPSTPSACGSGGSWPGSPSR